MEIKYLLTVPYPGKEKVILVIEELARWENERNEKYRVVDWQFTAGETRIKLKSLHPKSAPKQAIKGIFFTEV